MFYLRFVFMFCAAALAAIIATPAEAQTRYPLHCRAGGDMAINVMGQESGGGTEVIVSYRRSTSTTGLAAGQCTWHDRVVNSAEPVAFRIIFRARMNVDYRPRPGRNAGDRADAFVIEGGPDTALARSFLATLKAGRSFEVQAFNPGRTPMNAINFREVPAR